MSARTRGGDHPVAPATDTDDPEAGGIRPVSLAARGLECRRGHHTVLTGVDLDVPAGVRLAVVGANGIGKSTLLRALAGLDAPAAGTVTVDGADLHAMTSRDRARLVAVQGQEETPAADLTLAEAVDLGRTPHRRPWSAGSRRERRIVEDALEAVGLGGHGDRSCLRLSGGERHRVVLARTLAQSAPLLVLDEPTNHLDAAWRLRLMALLDRLDRTVIAAMHDLDLVLRHFDAVAVVDAGGVLAHGVPVETLTPELLREVFGVGGQVVAHPRTGLPHLLLDEAVPAAADDDPHHRAPSTTEIEDQR